MNLKYLQIIGFISNSWLDRLPYIIMGLNTFSTIINEPLSALVPGEQRVHDALPAWDTSPSAQGMHIFSIESNREPAPHSVHVLSA